MFSILIQFENKNSQGLPCGCNTSQLSTWEHKCHFSLVEMLIHAGARVFYENEDMACPTQLACKTALLKVLMHNEPELEIQSGKFSLGKTELVTLKKRIKLLNY